MSTCTMPGRNDANSAVDKPSFSIWPGRRLAKKHVRLRDESTKAPYALGM